MLAFDSEADGGSGLMLEVAGNCDERALGALYVQNDLPTIEESLCKIARCVARW